MNNFSLFNLWTKLVSNFMLKISVVYADMLISILFQSLKIFNSQWFFEFLWWHWVQYTERFSIIRWLKLILSDDFLISKKTELIQTIFILVRIIDSSYFPSSIRQRPFIMFPDVNMILLQNLSLEMKVKAISLLTCFTYLLVLEVELWC